MIDNSGLLAAASAWHNRWRIAEAVAAVDVSVALHVDVDAARAVESAVAVGGTRQVDIGGDLAWGIDWATEVDSERYTRHIMLIVTAYCSSADLRSHEPERLKL